MKKQIKKEWSDMKKDWKINGVFYTGIFALLVLGIVAILSFATIHISGEIEAEGYFNAESYSGIPFELEKFSGNVELDIPLIMLYYVNNPFQYIKLPN